ncbi:MAG: hypothetical protein AAGH15_19145 [Myxococcota bacterium]
MARHMSKLAGGLALAFLLACGAKEAPPPDPEPEAEAEAEAEPTAQAEPEEPEAPTAEAVPVVEDFVEAAEAEITAENLEDELARLEAEIGAE